MSRSTTILAGGRGVDQTLRPRARALGGRAGRSVVAALFALPMVLVFGLFAWWPIISGAVMSFQSVNLGIDSTWVGLENFRYVLTDPNTMTSVRNTGYFTALGILLGFPLPLLLAVCLSEFRRARGILSLLAYLPVVIPPVVGVLLWKFFYDPSSTGVFNSLLGIVGIDPLPWLNSTTMAMPAIVLEATWASFGTATIIYLAALTGVRRELYEAAELDGAGILARVRHVTLPQIRGVLLVMLLLQIIGTMQVFTEPFLFTGGGPELATQTVLLQVYQYAFVNGDYGAATALSVMLALVLGVFSVAFTHLTARWSDG